MSIEVCMMIYRYEKKNHRENGESHENQYLSGLLKVFVFLKLPDKSFSNILSFREYRVMQNET